jgi:homocitrate synthase
LTAFTHKAGVHTNAVLRRPETYEVLNPSDFGLRRHIEVASRLTGKAAIRHRASELGLRLDDSTLREVTRRVKSLAEQRPINLADVDAVLNEPRTVVAG